MSKIFLYALFLCLFFVSNSQAQTAKVQGLLKQILDLPAPVPRSTDETQTTKKERDAGFLSIDNVPSDDAPIEDLVDYWTNQNSNFSRLSYQIKPTEKTVERLLEYSEKNPSSIMSFLNILPVNTDVAETVKRIFDQLPEEGDESYTREAVETWLKSNSRYYLDELIRQAQKVKDQNNYVSNEYQFALRNLARVDWDSAKPIVDRLMSDVTQPYSAVLAKWVSYEHAMETGDTSTAESFRRDLQKIVEDKNAPWAMRDLAMDSLALSGDWDGRDDWYISLLEDETLLTIQDNGYTGLTTLISVSKPGKFTEAMIKLTKSSNFAARSAAVRNLLNSLDKNRKDVLEALLPWLTNPAWIKPAGESQRATLINIYGEADFPEAVPGLIWVVQNEKESNRAYAALALTKYKDIRAVPALRMALAEEKNTEFRKYIIGALITSGGIGDDEQMTSLETYATLISTPEGQQKVVSGEYYTEDGAEPLALPIIIGKFVAEQEEPGEGLATRAIERLKVLRRTKPAVAQTLAAIMQKWKGRMIFLEIIRQVKTGEAEVEAVLNLLARRKDSREKMPNELLALRGSSGIGRGIGACLAEDENEFLSILTNGDAESQTAMFACARLIRARLPVSRIGGFLTNPNPLLALSAERYLETEDSLEARKMILAHRPNEILILGAQEAFFPNSVKTVPGSEALNALFESVNGLYFAGSNSEAIGKTEEKLRNEMKQTPDLLAVYAFVPDTESGQQVVRLYKDRVVYAFYEDAARYWERTLDADEYEAFYNFLLESKIDSLSSFGTSCEEEACSSAEFIMFGRGGGRRVFFGNNGEFPPIIAKLKAFFDNFGKGDVQLNYWLASKVKGLEVLLSDKNFNALAVWKKDADFRVLVEDNVKKAEIEKDLEEREKQENSIEIDSEDYQQIQARYQAQQKRRMQMQYAHLFWRKVENGKLAAETTQPAEMPVLFDATQISEAEGIRLFPRAWQVRAGNAEIRVGEDYYQNNLFRVSSTQQAVKIKDGTFSNPIVTADGKWVVVSKAAEDWSKPNGVVRINLQTRKEFAINILPSDTLMPIAFIASQNKVLLYRAKGKIYRTENGLEQYDMGEGDEEYYEPQTDTTPNPSPATPEFYLLDAETGAVQLVKGEFRPLLQMTYRPLQPTGNPNEFWAAIYDEKTKMTHIGRYNDKTFKFTTVKTIPEIKLNSMQIWVEEKNAKIYFVYQGHLLGLPLKNE